MVTSVTGAPLSATASKSAVAICESAGGAASMLNDDSRVQRRTADSHGETCSGPIRPVASVIVSVPTLAAKRSKIVVARRTASAPSQMIWMRRMALIAPASSARRTIAIVFELTSTPTGSTTHEAMLRATQEQLSAKVFSSWKLYPRKRGPGSLLSVTMRTSRGPHHPASCTASFAPSSANATSASRTMPTSWSHVNARRKSSAESSSGRSRKSKVSGDSLLTTSSSGAAGTGLPFHGISLGCERAMSIRT
mmetsp:Transcript_28926/g.89539  ORF Transcript_28926/g.89539 Transcript_28926/m.89539 type:complete len:251 (-) Transcript_28926:123-875(-)